MILFIFGCVHQVSSRSSYYWKTRRVECENHGLNISRCSLHEDDSKAELNPGCFEEVDAKNNTRIYCRLNCEESDETTVLAKVPNWNHECNHHFNYELERRRRDWYLWRSDRCTAATIAFHIRCGFPRDPRIFYIQNKHLFEYEDNEA
uniref:Apple domain-containing protein n=1 Tax=Panagrellus redivivus TaxID=6233 RepID=A0A7E4VMY3_PANRE